MWTDYYLSLALSITICIAVLTALWFAIRRSHETGYGFDWGDRVTLAWLLTLGAYFGVAAVRDWEARDSSAPWWLISGRAALAVVSIAWAVAIARDREIPLSKQ